MKSLFYLYSKIVPKGKGILHKFIFIFYSSGQLFNKDFNNYSKDARRMNPQRYSSTAHLLKSISYFRNLLFTGGAFVLTL
jgi:hypothetical protein